MQLRLVIDVVANETHFLLNLPGSPSMKTPQLVLINSFQLLATFGTRDEIKRRLRKTKHASERHVGLSERDFREDEIGTKATSRVEAAEPYDFWARLHFLAFFLSYETEN